MHGYEYHKCWRLSSHLQRPFVSDENPDARWQGSFELCQILKINQCCDFRCSYFSSTTFTYFSKLFHILRIYSRHFNYWLIILKTTRNEIDLKNTTSMFEVKNTHICSSKIVFEVYKGCMLMFLIKRKNHLQIFHHIFFNIYTRTGF